VDLGRVGVWWSGAWRADGHESVEVAAEIEALGFGAIWTTGAFEPGLRPRFSALLAATSRIVVASGVVSVWRNTPEELTEAVAGIEGSYPGRFLLGLGASHAAIVDGYARPYTRVAHFLDGLDAAAHPVPTERRALAALGPRMLALAGHRSAGAHPYFVPVEHTALARETLGAGPLLAPELTVVLDADATRARQLARTFTAGYLALPNYANNLRSLGYSEDDLRDGGSDRLVDAVVAWGDDGALARRVDDHLQAGADHVCLQVLSTRRGFPLDEYRRLADVVGAR
jgi:probable F420-dependent oxidoreductase